MSDQFTLSFYLIDEGDLDIPDVHWFGRPEEVRRWARLRLAVLASDERRSHRLRPLRCTMKNSADERVDELALA